MIDWKRGDIFTDSFKQTIVVLSASISCLRGIAILEKMPTFGYLPEMWYSTGISSLVKLGTLSKIDLLDKQMNESWLEDMRRQIRADLNELDEEELEITELTPVYDFETHIRPWDGTEVHSITGIPAIEYNKINLSKKISDDL